MTAIFRWTTPRTAIVEPRPVDNACSGQHGTSLGATLRRMTSEAFVRPPDTDAIAEHLEQVITRGQRFRPGVWFLVCDASPSEVLVHFPVDGVPAEPSEEECRHVAGFFADTAAQLDGTAGMVVVVTRPGAAIVGDIDRRWYRAARDACAEHGVRLLSVHLLTPNESREMFLDDVM